MATFQYRNGLGNSAAYQVSGKPFATGTALPDPDVTAAAVELQFPSVTKSITFVPHPTAGGAYWIGFSDVGVRGTQKFLFKNEFGDPYASLTIDAKVTSIFMKAVDSGAAPTALVYASLTSIETGSIVNNWSGSAGVG